MFGESTIFTGKLIGSIVVAGGFGMEPALNTFFPAFLHTRAIQVACVGVSILEYQFNPLLQKSGMGKKLEEADWAIDMAKSVAKRLVNMYTSPALPIVKNMIGLKGLRVSEKEESISKPGEQLTWTPEAKEQLGKLPFFVRPMAKRTIEDEARERNMSEINLELMLEVKKRMGK